MRNAPVAFRLNDEESEELVQNMAARGLHEKSAYFRLLIHEDAERLRH